MRKGIAISAGSAGPALSEALRWAQAAGVEAALVPAAAAADGPPSREAADARILRERRGARGWDGEEIQRRLAQPAWRAVVRLIGGDCAGLLLMAPDGEARAALGLLEPAAGMDLAPLRLAMGAGGALDYALLAAPPAAPGALAAAMATAGAAISRAWEQTLRPVVVDFSPAGGKLAAATAALRERDGAQNIQLYSPFFYSHGVLRAEALLAAIRERGPGAPLIAVPALGGAFAARLAAEGGHLSGTLFAGAERPAAWLEADASAEQIALTLQALARAGSADAD
ncbi:MAG: hypothetical protein ACRD13_09970 [Terriglobales bacterium]